VRCKPVHFSRKPKAGANLRLGTGASQSWGGNRLAVNPSLRRLDMFAGSGGTGQAQGLPLRWARRALIWGRGTGALVAQGYIRTHTRRRVEGCHGGVAGGVPPHKGGPELQGSGVRGQGLRGEVLGGRAREWRGTRTHGRVGTGRVDDTLEPRTHGGGALGRRLHWPA